jgi:hypothetical protein
MSNLRFTFSNLSVVCGEKVAEFPGFLCTRHPSREADFNQAFLLDERAFEPGVLRRVQDFFRETRSTWCIVVPPDLAGRFDKASKRIRISQRRVMPEMIMMNKSISIPPPPRGLKITRVETVNDMRTHTRTMMSGFGLGRKNPLRSMLNSKSLAETLSELYIGWASGRPVATSVSYVSEGVAGIFGVSTVPKARGRGYGEAMTWAAMGDGLAKKCKFFSLQASPMGFPVYHRMGFRRIFDIEEWDVPAKAPEVVS